MKYIRVSKKLPCPICGKNDNCKISEDGSLAYCRRVSAGGVKEGRDGGYVHVLIDDANFTPKLKLTPAPKIPEIKTISRKPEHLNDIYSEFLANLVLAKNHESDLKARGLSEIDIHLHGYKSMPTELYANVICSSMAEAFDLRGVPGFYRQPATGKWHFIDYRNATGFLVPIRNSNYDIVALQLRRDDAQKPKYLMMSSANYDGGASSGTPPHFAILGIAGLRASFESIIITEGALKANIIAKFTNEPTVGLVGVGCFDASFPELLFKAFPNLKKIQIAFDIDWMVNPAVKAQRLRLEKTLEKLNIQTTILSWNRDFKGLDDYLLNQNNQFRRAA